MRPGWYNFFILAGTIAAAVTWWMVVTTISPEQGGRIALVYFFSSLFFTVTGGIYLGTYLLQSKILGRLSPVACARVGTRQALLFATLIVVALALQSWRLLTALNAVILIVLLTFIELLLVTRERHPMPRSR